MWIHRLWIEFPKWCAPNGKYIKIIILLILRGIRTWVTYSGSVWIFLYTHHCLCACVREVQSTVHGDVGHQMGLKSNQGNCVCILSWTFWNSWECLRKKWDWLQGSILESFVSFCRCWFFSWMLFSSSTNFYNGFEIADNKRLTNLHMYKCKPIHYICVYICIISNPQWGWLKYYLQV